MLALTWDTDILFEKLRQNWKKNLLHYVTLGVDFMQSLSYFSISLVMIRGL